MHIKRIFLASSAELKADRDAVEIAINRLNKRWVHRGMFLHLEMWEDFDDSVSPTRKQDDYNKALRACDMAAVLAYSKVGQYTAEEFEEAITAFKATGQPRVLVYLKQNPPAARPAADVASLDAFEARLQTLGHFPVSYADAGALCTHLVTQLERQVEDGPWKLETDLRPASSATAPTATGGVTVGGDNQGNINTGQQTLHSEGAMIFGNVKAQTFVGRDFHGTLQINPAPAAPDWATLMAPVHAAIASLADTSTQVAAKAVVADLQDELSQAEPKDKLLARLVGHLYRLAPAAAGALAAIWAEPVLQQMAKPATDAVLDALGLK